MDSCFADHAYTDCPVELACFSNLKWATICFSPHLAHKSTSSIPRNGSAIYWIKKHHMYWDYVIWLGSLNELWMQNELDYDLPKKLKLLHTYIVQMGYLSICDQVVNLYCNTLMRFQSHLIHWHKLKQLDCFLVVIFISIYSKVTNIIVRHGVGEFYIHFLSVDKKVIKDTCGGFVNCSYVYCKTSVYVQCCNCKRFWV